MTNFFNLKIRPSGEKFYNQGLNEVRKLPMHLKVFAVWGNQDEYNRAMKVILQKNLVTDAGEHHISESREWYKTSPMDPQTKADTEDLKTTYRRLFEDLTLEKSYGGEKK